MPAKKRKAIGRPPIDPALRRVVLPPQRVRPDVLAWLEARPGGIGRAIDHAVTCARMVDRQFTAAGVLRPLTPPP